MTKPKLNPSPLATVFLSGLSHSPYYKTLTEGDLPPHTELTLLRDPANSFYTYAVKVMHQGEQVGWIPKGQNEDISRHLSLEIPLHAFVIFHDWDKSVTRRLQIIIYTEAAHQPTVCETFFSTLLNEFLPEELQDLIENCILNSEIEQDALEEAHRLYPSIIPADMYQYLLTHFEE